jgi:hypothetical protein
MISRKATKQFLARERRDFRPWKKLTKRELGDMMRALPVRPPIWSKLSKHQKVCLLIGIETGRFGFFLDPGMGKTLLNIALARWFKKAGLAKHNLVLVPRKINKGEWKREIAKHSPSSTVCILRGSTEQKWRRLERTKALFIVETYAGFIRMICDLEERKTRRKSRKKMRLKPNRKRVKAVAEKCQITTADESTFVGSHRAVTFRILRAISKLVPYFFELTGTPFGRDPTPLWGQMFLLDGGYSLGETLGLFRSAFFKESRNFWGGFDYKFDKEKQGKLHRCLAHGTIRYEADEGDLPRITTIVRNVQLPHDAEDYYLAAKRAIRQARGDKMETKRGFLRMRQISSGFLGFKDDETGERAEIDFDPKPKLEALISDAEDICQGHKAIIFHEFVHSGDLICRELSRVGIGWARGGGQTKNWDNVLRDFDNDDQIRTLVLNNSCVFGPNLQVARYGLVFESPLSVINRKQLIRRFHRQYSTHGRVFLIDYCATATDRQILKFHAEGKDLFEAIIEGRAKLK